MIKEKINFKKLYHLLNLDYPQHYLSIEDQTNNIINYIMNDFFVKNKDFLKDKYVVFESQDDAYSLLAYHILKHIQAVSPEPFPILFYGSKIKMYKREKIKDKKISKRKLKKLMQLNKVLLISCYNPIYNVIPPKRKFNDFKIRYDIIRRLTLSEFDEARNFQNIYLTKKEIKERFLPEMIDLSNFCNGGSYSHSLIEYFSDLIKDIKTEHVYIVKMTGNAEQDNESINDIIDTDNLVFYYFENDKCYEFLKSHFERFLKNKSNIPNSNYFNVNEFDMVKFLKPEITFIGNFTEEEKDLWRKE